MPKMLTAADLLDADREIHHVDPREVSLVDFPANLESFVVVKNQGGAPAPPAPPAAAPATQEGTQAAIGELTKSLETVQAQLGEIRKALGAQPAPAAPAAPATPPPAAPSAPADVATAVAIEVRKALTDAGVIKAPKTEIQQLAENQAAFQAEVTKAFTAIVQKMAETAPAAAPAASAAPPPSGQPAPPAQPVVDVAIQKNAELDPKDPNYNPEMEPLLSTLLFSGLQEPPPSGAAN